LAFALGTLSGTDVSGVAHVAPAIRKSQNWTWAAAALVLAAVSAAVWLFVHEGAGAHRMQFALPLPGEVSQMALSADGRMLAFVSPDEKTGVLTLFVQRVGEASSNELAGTEDATYPFWSPDDAYVGFFAKGKLMKIAAGGGSPQIITSAPFGRGGTWGARNVILYAPQPQGVLWRVNADGTGAASLNPAMLTQGEHSHRWPVFLPDGNHFIFWGGNFNNVRDDRGRAIYESSLDAGEKTLVVEANSNAVLGRDHIFYANDKRQLIAMAFDPGTGKVSGEPHIIAESVAFQPSIVWGAFSASDNGTVVYSSSMQTTVSSLTWVDRAGKELGHVGDPGTMANPTLSPDGQRVAVDIADLKTNNVDVWLESLGGGSNTRFTFDPSEEAAAVWSRDGKTVAYRSVGGQVELMSKPASGLEREKTLLNMDIAGDILPNDWTLDDKQILCTVFFPNHSATRTTGLGLVPATGGEPKILFETSGSERNGQISPDGKWLAYASTESGDWEVYVTTFPGAAGKWQISRGGGTEPRWRGDGKELFYIAQSGILMGSPVSAAGTFSSGTPQPLFQVRGRAAVSSTDIFTYDVARDGKQFLVNRYLKPDHPLPLTIILNATAEDQK